MLYVICGKLPFPSKREEIYKSNRFVYACKCIEMYNYNNCVFLSKILNFLNFIFQLMIINNT